VYEIEKIVISNPNGQTVLNITGEPCAYTGQPSTTVIRTQGVEIHEGKGLNLSNLQLFGSGKYGVAIDPAIRKGSTDCKIENVYVDGYEVGIGVGVSGQAQNSDSNIFNRIWVANAKTAMAFGHTQTRSNIVSNLKCWTGVETVFDTVNYGEGKGELPRVYNANIVGAYQLFQTNNQYSTGSFNDVYCESLYRIGDAYGGWLPIKFNNCHFDLDVTRDFPENIATGNNLHFDGGLIRYYDGKGDWKPMNFNCQTNNTGRVSFRNMWMNNPASFGNDADNVENFSYENVTFNNVAEYSTPVFSQTYSEYFNYTKGVYGNAFEMADWAGSDIYKIGQPVISRHGVVGIVDNIEGKKITLKYCVKVPDGTQVGNQLPNGK
jgi:hypothetical protein